MASLTLRRLKALSEIYGIVCALYRSRERGAIPDSIEVDPEAQHDTVTEKQGFEAISLNHLTDEQREEVRIMAKPFDGLWGPELGKVNITTHRLELEEGTKPIYSQPYKAGGERRRIIEEHVEKMQDLGVIEPTVSEWAAPVC